MAAVNITITRALTLCLVLADTDGIIFNESNDSDRIANDVFNDNFNTCIDLKFSDIDKHWKTYGSIAVAEVRIRLRPSTNFNIKDFLHWVRGSIRMS